MRVCVCVRARAPLAAPRPATSPRFLDLNFNDHFHYKVLIFHENLGAAQRNLIESNTRSDVTLHRVSFRIPAFLDANYVPRWYKGYSLGVFGVYHQRLDTGRFCARTIARLLDMRLCLCLCLCLCLSLSRSHDCSTCACRRICN